MNCCEIEENKDIQLICCTISGRTILSNFLNNYNGLKNDFVQNTVDKNDTIPVIEKNLIILSNIISASLMSIHPNMNEINFDNTKKLTISMFRFYA